MQTTHPGTIQLEGDTASGRAYVLTFGRFRDGGSHLNYSAYHDRYQRTPDGWKFAERVDEVVYLDTSALAGSPPRPSNTPIVRQFWSPGRPKLTKDPLPARRDRN